MRYLCLATEIAKGGGGFRAPQRRYAIAVGCEVAHAGDFVYADDLDLGNPAAFDPIGISCRICERQNCAQRAVPPLKGRLVVEHDLKLIMRLCDIVVVLNKGQQIAIGTPAERRDTSFISRSIASQMYRIFRPPNGRR